MPTPNNTQHHKTQWNQEAHQLADHPKIVLTNQQFDQFSQLCETTLKPSDKIKAAAKALDEEGFTFKVNL